MKKLLAKAKYFGYEVIEQSKKYIIVRLRDGRKEYWDIYGRINSRK